MKYLLLLLLIFPTLAIAEGESCEHKKSETLEEALDCLRKAFRDYEETVKEMKSIYLRPRDNRVPTDFCQQLGCPTSSCDVISTGSGQIAGVSCGKK